MKNKKPNTIINILLAEDDFDDRNFFEKAIQLLPFEVNLKIVNNGELLMEYLAENLQNLPNIIFLDNSMPHKTGIECLSDIQENESLNKIPIVMLSTSYTKDFSYEKGIKEMLLKMGAKEYIRKQNDINGLKLVIEKSLKSVLEFENPKKYDKAIKNSSSRRRF